ncbi:MAG: AI-2E family transporter [Candidatus Brennerbacteria bacterium]|nr:AI-2E family transporter [Candidatus Brennerbacteria bacterium]
MDAPSSRFEISWLSLFRLAVFGGMIAVLILARSVMGVFVVAIVVALGLDPFVSFLERRRIPRLLGTSLVFFAAALALGAVVYLMLPIVITELGSFIAHFDETFRGLFNIGIPRGVIEQVTQNFEQALAFFSSSDFSVAGAIGSLFERLLFVAAVIVISFYLTVEEKGTERFFRVVLPDAYERAFFSVFSVFKEKIRNWFSAQLGLSLAVGGIVALGLWLLGVRYYLALGLIAAVFEVVPIIGPIITGAVGFLVAVGDSWTLGLYTLLFFFLVQQLENHILTPVVMGRAVKVHPVMVVMALLAGGEIAGFTGVLLSVPIAVAAQEVFNYLAEQKRERQGLA